MPAVKFFAGLDLKQKSSFLDGPYINKKRFKFNIFLAVFGLSHEKMIYKRGPMV